MKIKKQYELNEDAWIHLGGDRLSKGKVIDIFDLAHAGYSKDIEFYIIEIPTEIDPLLEVRTWEQMSQDPKGPIGAYRSIRQEIATKKFLGKVGIKIPPESQIEKVQFLPENTTVDIEETKTEITEVLDIYDPTPEEVNAAIERSIRQNKEMYRVNTLSEKPKRYYGKKKHEKRA
jgi:hypothetical protein